MPKIFLTLFILIISVSLVLAIPKAFGDELDEINKQIEELTESLNTSKASTIPLQEQVDSIRGRVTFIEQDIANKKQSIEESYANLANQQVELNAAIRNFYIKSYYNTPILIFLSSNSASQITRLLAYQKAAADQDKQIIVNIALSINSLEERKRNLESEQTRLASTKVKLDKIIKDAKLYQGVLSSQIAELSKRQQEIINQRSGQFTATIGDSNLADDYYASITGFREAAPSGYFAVFSFGAYTHRKGMSQYGARGRAISGQGPEEILSAYYPGFALKKDYDSNAQVNVQGHGIFNIEDYVKRIYEVPASWTENNSAVLKAQAVAARTYALDSMRRNGSICTTEACQVFKPEPKGGAWEQAVNDTTGWVLMNGDNPAFTQYASTHGGFTTTSGWDTTDGSGGGNFVDKSYDKIGGSPWLYKAWYTKGYSVSSDKCGRANPWLSPQEMADVVNAAVALKSGGVDTSRITPVTTSCWGGNPYSMEELRNITPGSISSATSVSVSQGNGTTSSVNINGISLSGDEFKKAFNLRAPGRLSIPQSGFAFFNVEKK